MDIQMSKGFMFIGSSPSNLSLKIPFPSSKSTPFETTRLVDSARNSNGSVVGQQAGRSMDKQSMTWTVMDTKTWWEINNWIESNGMFFYCRYFSHNFGVWKIRRFYCSNFTCQPFNVDKITGIPEYYTDCGFNVIDCGEKE